MKTTYIQYYGKVNDNNARSLMSRCAQIIEGGNVQKLYFMFSSPGGNVQAGITLYNFLKALPVPIVMHNVGSIDSIANCIFLSADQRLSNLNASFLFHGISWNPGGSQVDWAEMQERLSSFERDREMITNIISGRTEISRNELDAFFNQGKTLCPRFALDKNVVQHVMEAKVPEGSPFIVLDLE